MKTTKLIKNIAMFCLLLTFSSGFGQDVGGIISKKAKNRANKQINKTVDDGLDAIEGKDKKKTSPKEDKNTNTNSDVVEVSTNSMGSTVPLDNFIDPGTAIFVDDFNTERPTEFPSKWVQVKGALQNNQVITNGKKDGVVETISGYSTIKPNISNENYLGSEFKVEMKAYFHNKGNEQYVIKLKNSEDPYANHDVRIGNGVMWNGADNISRLPSGIWKEGWHTIQLSFNKGYMKGYLDGYMLVNDPDITTNEDHVRKMFTNLELYIISPSVNKNPSKPEMVTYFAIGGKGHDLYTRLKTDGRLVMNNINFEVNSYNLTSDSFTVLDQIAAMMAQNVEVRLNIHGHTDSDGSDTSNQTLSENRALSVMKYLTGKGVDPGRLSSAGYGESNPIAEGNSPEAKAKNRRVEFVLMEQK
ncbi:hypothetical protein C5O00_10625 [Pukyongia salina]|uniref:OmpA-like domain-containing protein n=1 Tax=Pukyongia salina TaxID=2094025 RepID=A0A2S0HY31_9FLAO|nr:OmpA family protein [Pukyongia salina]AVI51591.1 hypothetical protein C5O00_10625 [Pukyongia salina]